jgi:predicted RNA-binding Zn-ribbon protein involved in translation (DUF1610 family)
MVQNLPFLRRDPRTLPCWRCRAKIWVAIDMQITSIEAKHRFDKTEFSDDFWDGRAQSIYTVYICPQCGEGIQFQRKNFERALERHPWINVTPETARSFDDFARKHFGDCKNYLDWVCPNCGLATRVYMGFCGGDHHGTIRISLIDVLEAMPPPTAC